MHRPLIRLAAALSLLVGVLIAVRAAPASQTAEETPEGWQERLPRLDRELLGEIVGKPVPELTADLEWAGRGPKKTWDDYRGKVVVIKTWTTGTSKGRRAPGQMAELKTELFDIEGLEVLLLHTPQGASKVERYLEREPVRHPLIIDPSGAFCDELGAYRRPIAYVLDRYGVVRYAGLNDLGVREAVKKIAAESYDPARVVERESDKPAEEVTWPSFNQPVSNATDFRGRKAPDFHVAQWLTPGVNVGEKVAVIDFWATWCGPCVRSIPHMNELQTAFRDDVNVIGISDESNGAFENGLRKARLSPRSFNYSLALDPGKRMSRDLGIRGIPHAIVVSRDGIVRWQGHAAALTSGVLRRIVEADRAANGAVVTTNPRRYRWTKK